MAKVFYNPHKYPVAVTATGGGRIVLNPLVPGRKPETITGDSYEGLVKMGTLAEFTPEVEQKLRELYVKQAEMAMRLRRRHVMGNVPLPIPKPVQPKYEGVRETNEIEFRKKAAEPLVKIETPPPTAEDRKAKLSDRKLDPAEVALLSRHDLEVLTVMELKKIINTHDYMGPAPVKNAKKDDLVNQIMSSVTTKPVSEADKG